MQTENVIDYIVDWLNTYCEHSAMRGFVAGVSGGIDSAVTSTLCARTGRPVYVLNMPIYQAKDQFLLSSRHIKWLESNYPGVKGVEVDLSPVFDAIHQTIPAELQDHLTMANTRARLRMLTLYAFSGHHNLLVAGTGNKVEDFGVGFYTKYGDGGVDLLPIGDLMKSEVYALGRSLGIIEGIISAPPTDGLWHDNRSDEDQLGATYDELEWAMTFEAAGGNESALSPRQHEVLMLFRKLHAANRHKMDPVPVVKIPESLKIIGG